MIEGIIKALTKKLSNFIGTKIGQKALKSQSLKDVNVNENFEYSLKSPNVRTIAGVVVIILGIGFWIYGFIVYGFSNVNDNFLTSIFIGVALILLGTYPVLDALTYEVIYTSSTVSKKSISKKQEINWEDIKKIYPSKNNAIVLETDNDKVTIKPFLRGIHDFMYVVISKFEEEMIAGLLEKEITRKVIVDTYKKYEIV